jgi:uncharacterized protein HemX
MAAPERKGHWLAVLVPVAVAIGSAAWVFNTLDQQHRQTTNALMQRLADLESRLAQQDDRAMSQAERDMIAATARDLRDVSTLTMQINANVLENSKKIHSIANTPRPARQSAPRPVQVFPDMPVIQGPRPEPPAPRKGPYAIEGNSQ